MCSRRGTHFEESTVDPGTVTRVRLKWVDAKAALDSVESLPEANGCFFFQYVSNPFTLCCLGFSFPKMRNEGEKYPGTVVRFGIF